jgi:hypothetical protein
MNLVLRPRRRYLQTLQKTAMGGKSLRSARRGPATNCTRVGGVFRGEIPFLSAKPGRPARAIRPADLGFIRGMQDF